MESTRWLKMKKKKIVFLSLLLSIKPAPTGAHCFFPDPLHPWGGEDLSGNGFTVIMDTPPPHKQITTQKQN